MIKKLWFAVIAAFCIVIFALSVSASAVYSDSQITSDGFSSPSLLSDGNNRTYTVAASGGSVNVERDDGISSLYIVFDRLPEEWTITDTDTGTTVTCGKNGFLHEFVDLKSLFGYLPKSIRADFPGSVSIAEIYAFSVGELPDWVQIWNPPAEKADLLLFSSHSDDEQLFFAGILPYYAGELGYVVQVAYIVNHFDTHERPHEQLDGLWAVGVTNYPVISEFPDLYSESLDGAISVYTGRGYSFENFAEYITECVRRFKPLVVVSHDINGEYGHGTHILCTAAIRDFLLHTEDDEYFAESATQYGLWTPQKTYFHLYHENQITLDLDRPLESFGGRTAFEVTQDGFGHHKSQHWTWFYRWIYGTADAPITKASQITSYSPCLYGLYQTSVGSDIVGGDFFENIKTYAEIEAEKAAEEESMRIAEEESRREAESLAEAERLESESLAALEHESETNGIPSDEPGAKEDSIAIIFICIVAAGVFFTFVIIGASSRINRKSK